MVDVSPTSGNRFTVVTSDDQSGVIWIVSLLCLAYSLLTFCTRMGIKYKMLGIDDWALIAAQTIATGQYCAIFIALSHGLGKSKRITSEDERIQYSKPLYTAQILIMVSLTLSKCAVVLLIRRVFTRDMEQFWRICNFLLGIVILWGIAATLTISAGCPIQHYLPPSNENRCKGQLTRWKATTALDITTELIIVFLPAYLVWGLQMDFELKARVVTAFAFRLPVSVFALQFIRYLDASASSPNENVNLAAAMAWQQAEIGYSLMAATIPCLKSFIRSFDTGFGLEVGFTSNKSSSQDSEGIARSKFKMNIIRPSRQARLDPPGFMSNHDLCTGQSHTSTSIYHSRGRERDDLSTASAESQEMIIRRDSGRDT